MKGNGGCQIVSEMNGEMYGESADINFRRALGNKQFQSDKQPGSSVLEEINWALTALIIQGRS